MTIQEELNQVRIEKQKQDFYSLFNKLNNICKEETDMDIYEVLKQYDTLTNNAFSIVWELR
jgi:UDP-N-acetyl-D-mannosaminuronic acid transferase (WecB/TagA/CpsF family)